MELDDPVAVQEAHQAYRVFRYYVQCKSPNLDFVVWNQLSTLRGSVASEKTIIPGF
jgi:hypothetical protein